LIDPRLHEAVLAWYAEQGRDLPWRQTRDPYAILVSEMMLQQTQVDRVLPRYLAFLQQYPTVASLARASAADVIRAWQGLGYNLRAIRLQRIAQQVMADYAGQLPQTIEDLQKLSGIGRYTAAAVACFAFGHAEPVLDTNVRRVLGRIFLGPDRARSATAATLWDLAGRALPVTHAYAWNQALMDLGARICTETNPRCLICPAQPCCSSAGQVTRVVRERRARYGSSPPASGFVGSRRYYRGRVVERLRALAPGEMITLADLGVAIKADYQEQDHAWLQHVVEGLQRDGLVVVAADGRLSLP
jgi:A/G-specific adenine glycosylase